MRPGMPRGALSVKKIPESVAEVRKTTAEQMLKSHEERKRLFKLINKWGLSKGRKPAATPPYETGGGFLMEGGEASPNKAAKGDGQCSSTIWIM